MNADSNKVLTISLVLIVLVIVGLIVWYLSTMSMNLPASSAAATSTVATTTDTASKPSGSTAKSGSSAALADPASGNTAITPAKAPAPTITVFEPASGAPGDTIEIAGTGFTAQQNYILFGTSQGLHHQDGTPDNMIAVSTSLDGTLVSFTVPTSGPSGILCDASDKNCRNVAAIRITPGLYPITVMNASGTSKSVIFTVTAGQQ